MPLYVVKLFDGLVDFRLHRNMQNNRTNELDDQKNIREKLLVALGVILKVQDCEHVDGVEHADQQNELNGKYEFDLVVNLQIPMLTPFTLKL